MRGENPLWVRHDRAGRAGEGLTSHGFVKNLRAYALEADLTRINLHQTRHTYARFVGDLTGSVVETKT